MSDDNNFDNVSNNVDNTLATMQKKEQQKSGGTKVDLDFDELKLYFGDDYYPTPKICIHQPTIGDIVEFGDSKFYSIVSTLCSNPTSFRLQLWDMGIDWNKMADFDLFKLLIKNYDVEDTKLLFGDLNLSWFEEFHDNQSDCDVLVYIPRDDNGMPIELKFDSLDELTCIYEKDFIKIVEYLRYMFNIHPKVEKTRSKSTKEAIIDEERMNLVASQRNNNDINKPKSFLLPLISSLLNHPGFKYKKTELREVGIVEFMDSVRRLQTYESTTALMKGIYSGMVDTSKIKNLDKELNWMKDLNE